MKRVLLAGLASLSDLFQAALHNVAEPQYRRQFRSSRTYRQGYSQGPNTWAPRHWHDSTDPVQMARIEAASTKRERRAVKYANHANMSWHNNCAHDARPSLYPFSTWIGD